MRRKGCGELLVFLFLSAAVVGLAQTAQITGKVTDATGAPIAGAEVVIRNLATGLTRQTYTDESGYYTASLLPPGEYRVTVTREGFRPSTRTGIRLQVDQRAALNFTLEVGQLTEEVSVRAPAPLVSQVEASLGQVIGGRWITDLPLDGRDYLRMALLAAGVAEPPSGGRYGGFSTAGQRATQNNFLLNGFDNNPVELAGAQHRSETVKPSVDAIEEFKIQTNAYAAEFGRALGAVVNLVTKAGTNRFNGTLYEFLRNERLDARNFFDPPDKPKPPFKRNQFGFTVGGPAIRNRTFFFGDYEGTRVRESATIVSTIPTLKMRQGDFSEFLPAKVIRDPLTGHPFPDNMIPAERMDPLASLLITLYPEPKASGLASNYTYQPRREQNDNNFGLRLDHAVTARDQALLHVRRNVRRVPAVLNLPPPAFGSGGYDWSVAGWNLGMNWTRVLTPKLLANARVGWNYAGYRRQNPAAAGKDNWNALFGIPAVDHTQPGGFASITLTGYRGLGLGPFNGVDRDSQNRQLAGDLSWTRGRHTVKSGIQVLGSQNNIFNIRHEVGVFNFNGRFTGDAVADFLLGWVNEFTWSPRLQVNLRAWNIGAYVQDDYKLTRRLTLNLGVRYEVSLPWIDRYDRMGNFLLEEGPDKARLILAGQEGTGRMRRATIATDTNNVMPRLGLAFELTPRTVIRSGYGIFYGYVEPSGDSGLLITNPPFAYMIQQTSTPTEPAFLFAEGPKPESLTLERATGLTFSGYERRPPQPYAQQWNFNLQRQFGKDWLWEVGYAGARGVHLLIRLEGNYSPPGPGSLDAKRPVKATTLALRDKVLTVSPVGGVQWHKHSGNSTYHALVTRLERRFAGGVTLLASYTFSKTLGDTCGFSASGDSPSCGYQDPRNLRLEKGLDNQHVPHRFVVSGVWELPWGRGRRLGSDWSGLTEALFGGWAIGSIVSYVSGQPFNLAVAGNPANVGTFGIVTRPDVVGDPWAGKRTVERDFNTAAFAMPGQYRLGNAARNLLWDRAEFNWDFAALKELWLGERMRLQFRFEGFHFTNTPRFGTPGTTLGTATFGRITSAGTPRNLQFGLKFIF